MATAKKRQPIPVLPLEVARDAIRLGRPPAEVVAACGEESKLALGIEMLRAAIELLRAEGINHGVFGTYSERVMVQLTTDDIAQVDKHHATLVALPAVTRDMFDHAPDTQTAGDRTWRTAKLTLDGAQIDLSSAGRTRCARKLAGHQCTGENGHDGDHTFDGAQP